eukprot:scaffold32696_cov59-Phaeocystis_antarctica.AAC.1
MRSRPPYMSIDPDTHAKIAAAGYSSGFSDGFSAGQNTAGMVLVSDPPATTPELQRCIDAADQIKGVDGPLLQTLATICVTIDDPKLKAKYEPAKGPVDDNLDQPYKVTDGGVGALDAFKSSLASYGTVIDSITDWHDELEVAIPPFAALVVQPGPPAPSEAFIGVRPSPTPERLPPPLIISQLRENVVRLRQDPILILAWRGSTTLLDWVNDAAFSPTLCKPAPPAAMRPRNVPACRAPHNARPPHWAYP